MEPSLTVTLTSGQVLAVTLSGPAEAQVLAKIVAERAGLLVAAEVETRTYHLGTLPTANRGYDDRLTVRLGISRTTLLDMLHLWRDFAGHRGGLRHVMAGKKYWVSELACREWLTDIAVHRGSLGGPGRLAGRRTAEQNGGPTNR
ncbi:MAG: hypothetical protein ACRYG7_10250 [Janthinobacterium lividum]